MSMLDKITPSNLSYGLNLDQTFKDANQVTFALNGIRDSHDGGKIQYQSEPGNEAADNLPAGYTLLGWAYGINNELYLLSTNQINCEIGVYKQGVYVTHMNNDCLGWDNKYPMSVEFRLKNGCERIIYWCDGANPDGWFNFDRPELFKDDLGAWDCNLFKLTPNVTVPNIDLISVNDSGGSLPLGSYYFQVELLDKNLNSIYKTDLSPQTVVYDESSGDYFNNIDGGLNAPQYDTAIGGVPETSKSITLQFSNLDSTFDYIRVNVVRQIAGTQVVDAHAVGSLVPINATTIEWTYTGYNVNEGDYPLDYSEMLVDNIVYDTAYIQEQVQGRYVRANLKQDTRDYSQYQQHASAIKTEWVSKEVLVNTVEEVGNPKNPETYWYCTGFQGDEVYALGIRYVHKDGSWSPVFHIPGRVAETTDIEQILVVADATVGPLPATQVWKSDVEHIPEEDFESFVSGYVGSMIRRWKVFNTGSITTAHTTTHPYDYIGETGYYETETTYPEIYDCDGNLIWGQDYYGNDITNTSKIRHHRMPDRRIIPHYTGSVGEYIQPIGLRFVNIGYPNSDIVGHQFCYVKRTENNKTVLDSGWLTKANPIVIGSDTYAVLDPMFGYLSPSGSSYTRYNSANVFLNKNIFNPDYMKFNYYHRSEGNITNREIITTTSPDNLDLVFINYNLTSQVLGERTNHKVNNQVYVEPLTKTTAPVFPIGVYGLDPLSGDNLIYIDQALENVSTLFGSNDVYHTLATTDPPEYTISSVYSYKKSLAKPYSSLFNLSYCGMNFNPISSGALADNTLYMGDTIVSLLAPARTGGISTGDYFPQYGEDDPPASSAYVTTHSYTFMYEEHTLNGSLRHGQKDGGWENNYYNSDGNVNWALNKYTNNPTDPRPLLKPLFDVSPEFYGYNKDFSVQALGKAKSTIPITYNYCSECLGEYTNRIIFSPKSFDEEVYDLYRINKVNDYIDIPAHRGPITGLKYQNNLLIVMCKNGSFILQPNPQVLNTDTSTVYLGTGDFFAIPPAELMQTDMGYAGMQTKQHQCNTPHGHVWADQQRGQIFLFNGQLNELSNKGMTQWFKENLPSEMQLLNWDINGTDFPIDATTNVNGVGLIMYYDPRFKRLIITKKDFIPLNFDSRAVQVNQTKFDTATLTFQYWNGTGYTTVYPPTSTTYFQNTSWTLSFSFEYDSWTSWHSYRPVQAFWDDRHYYTLAYSELDASQIWRHKHKENYQKFYNSKKNFIIEWMVFDLMTRREYGVQYAGYTTQWDDTNKQWIPINETFNKGVFYNIDQSSGLVNLNLVDQHASPYYNTTVQNTTKSVIKTDQNYKIANIYDISTDSPVMTKDWDYVKLNGDYIDQVPFTDNIDSTKSPYEMGSLWDKWVKNRLYFKPTVDAKKVIILTTTNETNSIR